MVGLVGQSAVVHWMFTKLRATRKYIRRDPTGEEWEIARVMKSVLDRPCKVITKTQDTTTWLATDGCANAMLIHVDCLNQSACQIEELDNITSGPDYRPQIRENKVQADLLDMEILMTKHIADQLEPFLKFLLEFDLNY